MKISKIEIFNFRQFKGKINVDFDIDGKITVILGDNGTGKTTLMQFFNWTFFGTYHFDNDQNGKIYNLDLDKELSYGTEFSVSGTVMFFHDNHDHRLTRYETYKRQYNSSIRVDQSISLLVKNEFGNWEPYADPDKRINEILPRALSKYFFFDGERKISEFNTRAGDTLEKAIYSMFNIDVIKNACDHIGEISVSNSLLGKIAKLRSSSKSGLPKTAAEYLSMSQQANDKVVHYKNIIERKEFERDKYIGLIGELDQKIGQAKGTKILEETRQRNLRQIENENRNIAQAKDFFGKYLYKSAPYLLLLEKTFIAAQMIREKEKSEEVHFEGIRKDLINDVLEKGICICGKTIDEHSIDNLNHILQTMPPHSYKSIFYDFKIKANRYITEAKDNINNAETFLGNISSYRRNISVLEEINKDILAQMRTESEIQNDIDARESLQGKVRDLNSNIDGYKIEYSKYLHAKEVYRKNYEKALESENSLHEYETLIHIAKLAKEYFIQTLTSRIKQSKQILEQSIREVYRNISTTERKDIHLNSDYTLVVKNDDDSTYRSGGQDIIIMYSYIGGILTTLQKFGLEKEGKEFPLIIDAPFSKVDGSQLGSVTQALSRVAPQVVIMTFDSDRLDTRADRDLFGKVWRISSNATKTISKIEVSSL